MAALTQPPIELVPLQSVSYLDTIRPSVHPFLVEAPQENGLILMGAPKPFIEVTMLGVRVTEQEVTIARTDNGPLQVINMATYGDQKRLDVFSRPIPAVLISRTDRSPGWTMDDTELIVSSVFGFRKFLNLVTSRVHSIQRERQGLGKDTEMVQPSKNAARAL